jgi:hypothetical protein
MPTYSFEMLDSAKWKIITNVMPLNYSYQDYVKYLLFRLCLVPCLNEEDRETFNADIEETIDLNATRSKLLELCHHLQEPFSHSCENPEPFAA